MIYRTALSVANAIDSHYKGSREIHFSRVKQGLVKPCFFVKVLSTTWKRQISDFFLVSQRLEVRFIPESEDEYEEEIMETEYNLMLLLEQLPFISKIDDVTGEIESYDGSIRGINISTLDNDGELIFTVEYKFRVYSKHEKDLMETLSVDAKPKFGGKT